MTGDAPLRACGSLQCACAAVLLAEPPAAARVVSRNDPAPASWIVRVLGARLMAQGAVLAFWPTRRVAVVGCVVDATHALSMIALAAIRPRCRRAALTSAAVAAGWTIGGGLAAIRGSR